RRRQPAVTGSDVRSQHSRVGAAALGASGGGRREGNSPLARLRSDALMAAARGISAMGRPQPRHWPLRASRVQTLTQGVSIMEFLGTVGTIAAAGGNAIARLSQAIFTCPP